MATENTDQELATLAVEGTEYQFRAPTLEEFEEYEDALSGSKRKGPAFRQLCQKCLVKPELAALQELFRSKPATSVAIANTLCDMAGATIELTVKKG